MFGFEQLYSKTEQFQVKSIFINSFIHKDLIKMVRNLKIQSQPEY